ncbi:GNAT family N-acetyltransferase [Aliidiomarina iranensis]|uniref:GNAT family N-acetyltransferase n=1 Tax=Aliidiomarina iranensis TaxID=1434071 RepID=UPI00130029FA|nr:GNAT family N-acetyltransferase [Aliidiomarina iranensis]
MQNQEVAITAIAKIPSKAVGTLKQFDCGDKFLNEFARKQLIKNDKKNLHKGFVAIADEKVVGYVTTKVSSLVRSFLGQPGLPNSVPVLSLEQIATDVRYQRCKIGSRLLNEVLQVTIKVSQVTGVYGLQLWAHPSALNFYNTLGFSALSQK